MISNRIIYFKFWKVLTRYGILQALVADGIIRNYYCLYILKSESRPRLPSEKRLGGDCNPKFHNNNNNNANIVHTIILICIIEQHRQTWIKITISILNIIILCRPPFGNVSANTSPGPFNNYAMENYHNSSFEMIPRLWYYYNMFFKNNIINVRAP